jgi:hypothetical protein
VQQGFSPFSKATDIHDLMNAVASFRSHAPKPGSAQMVELIEQIVYAFDNLGKITLATDLNLRNSQIRVLYLLRFIKRSFEDRDWDDLSHQRLLYPPATQS